MMKVLLIATLALGVTAMPETFEEFEALRNQPAGKTPAQMGIPMDLAKHLAGKDRRVDRATAEAAIRRTWLAVNGKVRDPSPAVQSEISRLLKEQQHSLLQTDESKGEAEEAAQTEEAKREGADAAKEGEEADEEAENIKDDNDKWGVFRKESE